jgi:phosphate transport system permease protein
VAIDTGALRAGGPAGAARPLVLTKARTDRRMRFDRWATRLVALGGLSIIVSILMILIVITAEVFPLFRKPAARLLGTSSLASAPLASGLGVDEYREVAYALTADGVLRFVALGDGRAITAVPLPTLGEGRVASVAALGRDRYLIGTTDGRVLPLEVKFQVDFKDGRRAVTPAPIFGESWALAPSARRPILRLAAATPASGQLTVAQTGPTELMLQTVVETKALIGTATKTASVERLPVEVDGAITALRLDGRGEDLFIGTSRGQIVRFDLRDRASPARADVAHVPSGASVSVVDFLIGDRTLVVGDEGGGVSTWQVVPPPHGGALRMVGLHEFERHRAPVVAIGPSTRDKGFVTADVSGGLHVSYGTSGATLLRMDAGGPLRALVFAPKADGVLALDTNGRLVHWAVDNPNPEVTLRTLFGKVWYEGYSAPAYVWQSTGGSDDFEAKLSLTPLVYGTLKGTFYALLVAVPLALLAALYVSEFMHSAIKGYVKPVVEIMAALPSVVLGFLAGLWLAPLVERVVPGLFVLPPVLTVAILAGLLVYRTVPAGLRQRFRSGTEVFLLIPVVAAGAWSAFALGGAIEATLLGGDYHGWLLRALGLTYDQRNSLVVGIAMGFAVIPVIFTIAEDSLANVPQHLRAGSLALGATRWQTAVRVVVPTASPGIFSAVMIGFGRAVGETMIVLMATGNTPVMDWSIFSGFRALSANIAVELPEAPDGGTLFRVLFLAALLLFCLTFVVNTAAEVVRLWLRRKYRYL